MERLEPILKQKFWILLGVGILMTIIGWWMATGSLAATITARTKLVEEAFGMVPSGKIPNNDWSSKLATKNAEQDRAVIYTRALLWERQLNRMGWPKAVAPFAWQNGYRGEIPLAGRENYRVAYGFEVRRVWESLRPFNQLDGSGIVLYGSDERILPQRTWGTLAPSASDMWDAQEDLWLVESLFRAIVEINGGATAQRGDASIHMMEKFELRGGQPEGQRKAGGGTAPGGPGGAGMMGGGAGGGHSGPPMSGPGGFGGGMGGGGEGGGRNAQAASADFDPAEELGDDGSGSGRGAGGGGFAGAGMGSGPAGAHGGGGPGPGAPGAGGGPGMGPASGGVRRYIDDDAALPYKTRGFYMTVLMDHRKIPSLIAELSASEKSAWPVEIVRVQMVRLHDNDVDTRGGGGFGPMAGGGPAGIGPIGGIRPGMGPVAGPGGFPAIPGVGDNELPREGAFNDNPNAASQAAAGAAALDAALQDPFMARVAICGIITLYKEVKPEALAAIAQPAVATPAAPAAPAGVVPGAAPESPPSAPGDIPPATGAGQEPPAGGTPSPANGNAPVVPGVPAPSGGAGAETVPKPAAPTGNN
jgi:hypothetical protein